MNTIFVQIWRCFGDLSSQIYFPGNRLQIIEKCSSRCCRKPCLSYNAKTYVYVLRNQILIKPTGTGDAGSGLLYCEPTVCSGINFTLLLIFPSQATLRNLFHRIKIFHKIN